MPDNWIGTILLTDETEVSINGAKVNDLIELNDVGGVVVPVDEVAQPVLADKLKETDSVEVVSGLAVCYRGWDAAFASFDFELESTEDKYAYVVDNAIPSLVQLRETTVPAGETTLPSVVIPMEIVYPEYYLYSGVSEDSGSTASAEVEWTDTNGNVTFALRVDVTAYGTTLEYSLDGITYVSFPLTEAPTASMTLIYDSSSGTMTIQEREYTETKVEVIVPSYGDSTNIRAEATANVSAPALHRFSAFFLDASEVFTVLPNMTPPVGSHKRYKIIADKT